MAVTTYVYTVIPPISGHNENKVWTHRVSATKVMNDCFGREPLANQCAVVKRQTGRPMLERRQSKLWCTHRPFQSRRVPDRVTYFSITCSQVTPFFSVPHFCPNLRCTFPKVKLMWTLSAALNSLRFPPIHPGEISTFFKSPFLL